MKPLNYQKGFAPIVVLLIIAAVGIGSYTVSKLPEKFQQASQSEQNNQTTSGESVNTSLPEGAAVGDEILIGFKSGVTRSQAGIAHQNSKAQLKRNISQLNVDVIKTSAEKSVSDTIAQYKKLPEVEFVEPNFLASALLTPNDPLYNNQWNLKKVLAEDAYEVSKGGFGPIAIIDTGVDSSHPDLSGLVIEGYNTIDENNNSSDDHGHGTHVAGIASAQTDNSSGVASISYAAKILPVKVLNKDGSGTYDDVSEGIVYATDKGARIINMSLGGSSDSETLKRAVRYAQSKGSLIVAAAGNNGSNAPSYPAAYSGVLAVSASDQNDNLAAFSSYGSNIFVASPGVSITSSVPGGSYKQYSGTSMAAPHLAGLIALVLSSNSSLSGSDALDQIKKNAEKVGPYAYDSNGWNAYYGYGRISSGKTLTALASPSPSATASASPTSDPKKGNSGRGQQKARKLSESQLSFFIIQGEIENVEINQSKFVIKVSGGMPNVLELVTGNTVDVFIGAGTIIKHGNNGMQLDELTKGTRVHISGKVEQNKLFAKDVIIQGKPATLPQEESNSGQGNSSAQNGSSTTDNSNSNNAANNDSQDSSAQSNSNQNEQSPSDNNPSQNHIPSQAQDKGKVKGITTTDFWNIMLENIFGIL